MKTLVLGIGNKILKDDGIGPAVIQNLKKTYSHPDVVFETTNLSAMPLLDMLLGYDTLIVVDAVYSGAKAGEIRWLTERNLTVDPMAVSQHRMNIVRVLEIGRKLGMDIPEHVRILGIEANDVTCFGEELTPDVAEAIPAAVNMVIEEIASRQNGTVYSTPANITS